jgi:hypothetical protein
MTPPNCSFSPEILNYHHLTVGESSSGIFLFFSRVHFTLLDLGFQQCGFQSILGGEFSAIPCAEPARHRARYLYQLTDFRSTLPWTTYRDTFSLNEIFFSFRIESLVRLCHDNQWL